ncbi:tRNA (5-methylaminomethyl-2-thiouridine)(34)-methyltransferase MnmD [Ulvibacterium sp.]|uniref:tRNA (5-methylaminomethyl-2-thiouridine)(34)-methyltransferase MnmD n=1 Tax=Ulvibacterium sp. TaxID=2665914 RepID=UPI00262F5B06|nr:tRNA (5-methylaminomethyl-2-thiouridine)(34)-methyltransferase MnmD [Ulvibacterium sp.]
MKRKIVTTADGSTTIYLEGWDEHYHSKHGAIQEAYHVFIKNGLSLFNRGPISILEMGYGTALNALITFMEAEKAGVNVHYTGVEAHPILPEELEQLNYITELKAEKLLSVFEKMHKCPWERDYGISNNFVLHKKQIHFLDIDSQALFDLVYFDAFGARVQPELWTEAMFKKMFRSLKKDGILVTYAAKGSVRRAMQSVGFLVERLPGPPGKREMLRARKP